ncbi:MAG: hypothetical protein IPO82_13865 [Betaproteobacteria bacterium]|nr:hypothetical protein [Betaproteobacteria bacterium]MBK9676259.1 hypothetical protein [Betaproteobacteria bacterium]
MVEIVVRLKPSRRATAARERALPTPTTESTASVLTASGTAVVRSRLVAGSMAVAGSATRGQSRPRKCKSAPVAGDREWKGLRHLGKPGDVVAHRNLKVGTTTAVEARILFCKAS